MISGFSFASGSPRISQGPSVPWSENIVALDLGFEDEICSEYFCSCQSSKPFNQIVLQKASETHLLTWHLFWNLNAGKSLSTEPRILLCNEKIVAVDLRFPNHVCSEYFSLRQGQQLNVKSDSSPESVQNIFLDITFVLEPWGCSIFGIAGYRSGTAKRMILERESASQDPSVFSSIFEYKITSWLSFVSGSPRMPQGISEMKDTYLC